MKANKALKRLSKIEALMAEVAKRYSASAPHIRGMLQNAKAAIAHAKQAVRSQVSSAASKKSAPIKKAAKKTKAKKASASRKKAPVRKAAPKVPAAKTQKKRAPIRKIAKKKRPKKAARVSAGAATQVISQGLMPDELELIAPGSSEASQND
jgi:hypothetical protein